MVSSSHCPKRLLSTLAAFATTAAMELPSLAAAPKTYQVTGPVLESSSDMIAVQKSKVRWEIAHDASAKVTGDLKVGSKVTMEYRMTATTVDVKAEKAAAKAKTAKKK
jgi:hypothetical protein